MKEKIGMINERDSFLQGLVAPTSWPDEGLFLVGCQDPGWCRRTSRLVWQLNYYPFLLSCAGISDVARGNHWRGRWKAGSPDGVSSVPPMRGKGLNRIAIIQQVNTCLSAWCHRQGFGFCNLGTLFEKQGLLSMYGMHPTKWAVSVLANSLGNLVLVLRIKEFI